MRRAVLLVFMSRRLPTRNDSFCGWLDNGLKHISEPQSKFRMILAHGMYRLGDQDMPYRTMVTVICDYSFCGDCTEQLCTMRFPTGQ